MARDRVEFARIASPEEIAGYLTSLADGLKRGEVSVESEEQQLRLAPAGEVLLELTVKQKDQKGKIKVEIGWKPRAATAAAELKVGVGPRLTPS